MEIYRSGWIEYAPVYSITTAAGAGAASIVLVVLLLFCMHYSVVDSRDQRELLLMDIEHAAYRRHTNKNTLLTLVSYSAKRGVQSNDAREIRIEITKGLNA